MSLSRMLRVEVKSSMTTLGSGGTVRAMIYFSRRQRLAVARGLIDMVIWVVFNQHSGHVDIIFMPAWIFLLDSGMWRVMLHPAAPNHWQSTHMIHVHACTCA